LDRLLKQRLLGAVILVALLVILLPEWLDGAGHKSRYAQQISIPDKPVFEPMTQLMGKAGGMDAPVAGAAGAESTEPVKSRASSSIQAWALQVGSFSEMSNAQQLRDRLRAKAYPAYIDKQTSADKASYRVRIGPELDHARVEALRKSIMSTEKIDGIIVTHP